MKALPPECLSTSNKINKEFKNYITKQCKITNNNLIRLQETANMTKQEIAALKNLSNLDNIIIKPADKGGATVVMDIENYILEANRQLSDQNYYKKLKQPIFQENIPKILTILEKMKTERYISAKELEYLSGPRDCKPRTFYLLPKIHKPPETWTLPHKMPQGRPIVSDVNSESYRVSAYIDHFLNPLASKHEAYIKNTYDFVDRIRGQPTDTMDWLVTGDVTSLYTNMNIDRTIRIVKETLSKNPGGPGRPDKEILELLELTMKNNDFQFNGQCFLQICGTAMGKIYAPSLANLYLLEFDENARNNFDIKPRNYGRYLDDVFFTWRGSEADLQRFEDFLNSLIPGIKIKFEKSQKEINFLDTTIYKKWDPANQNFILQTKTFFKETDTHQLLLKTSHHPKHTTKGIIKSQMIRFKRISSCKSDYDNTCKILFKYLKQRGYSWSELRKQQKYVWNNWTEKDTNDPTPLKQEIIPIINEHNKIGADLTQIYRNIILSDELLKNNKIISASKNSKSLRQHLISSKIKGAIFVGVPGETDVTARLFKEGEKLHKPVGLKCGRPKCATCPHMTSGNDFHSSNLKKYFPLKNNVNCSSRNIIYLITCNKCHIQYVGETSNPLHTRLNAHRYDIKHNKPTPIAIHFNSPNHDLTDLKITPIEILTNNNKNLRLKRETYWQNTLSTNFPRGLNNLPTLHQSLFINLNITKISDLETFWALNEPDEK